MRYIQLVLILSIFSCSGNSGTKEKVLEGIQWVSLEEAQNRNQKEPKDFFIMVHANWCPKCKRFADETYSNPKVIEEINKMFYPVMINAHEPQTITFKGKNYNNANYDKTIGLNQMNSYHDILFELGAKSIPSIVFLNSKLDIVGSEMGFKEASELRSLMRMYKNN